MERLPVFPVAVLGMVLTSIFPVAAQATDLMYRYEYQTQWYEFETLHEAVEDAQARPGLWQELELESATGELEVPPGETVWYLSVPEIEAPIRQDATYYGPISGCGGSSSSYCSSLEEASSVIADGAAPYRCIVGDIVFEGTPVFDQWFGLIAGIPAPLNRALTGLTYHYDYQDRNAFGDCEGTIHTLGDAQLAVVEPHECPDYYSPHIATDKQTAECRATLRVPIKAFIPSDCTNGGNPCGILTGNKTETEVDYASPSLTFSRTYNSAQLTVVHAAGRGWQHNYEQRLIIYNGQYPRFYIDTRGNVLKLQSSGPGQYRVLTRSGAVLKWDATAQTWTLHQGQEREVFADDGTLLRLEDAHGITALVYDTNDRLVSITAPDGRALQLEYDNNGLRALVRPDGERVTYDYEVTPPIMNWPNPGLRLSRVTYPDAAYRTYHYEQAGFPFHLTGITDENGERFSTFTYNGAGKVTGSVHAGGVETVDIERLPDGTIHVTDPLGHVSIYHYIGVLNFRKLDHVEGGPCATCSNTDKARVYHATFGDILERTGFDDVVTAYTRDFYGRELSRTEAVGTPEQRVISTQWHATLLALPTRITEPGRVTDYTYDADGNRLTETVRDTATGVTRTTTWTYNANGQVLTVDGPRTNVADVTTYTYDAQGNLATVTNALGHVTQYTVYDVHGNPLEIVDPNGVVTKLAYDLRQRLISRTVAFGTADAATTTFDYDPVGQLVKTTLPDGCFIEYEYDAAHRMTAIEDSAGNRIDYTLDAMGNRIEEEVAGPGSIVFRELTRTYNTLNRLVAETTPEGNGTSYTYDAEGKRETVTDVQGNTATSHYDALDRLFETIDALSGVTSYDYDARDNLVQVVDPRGVTTDYTYNGFNELTETDSPDAGITTYAYDKAGNRISQTDARGITAAFSYDALNRLTGIDYPGITQDIDYTYDGGAGGCANCTGRLTRIDDETGYTEYGYDARGNLVSKTAQINGVGLPLAYGHDLADRLESVTYPDGSLVEYPRDAHGRITGVTFTPSGGSAQTLLSNIAHAPFGPVTGLTYGNGLTETRTFDQAGRLETIAVTGAGGILDTTHTWDATDNITAITDNLDATRSQTFDYDALYRLTDASGLYGDLGWTYDAVGNRTQQLETPNGGSLETTTYTYATTSNRLDSITDTSGSSTYQYDANGNTLDNGDHEFSYDDRNRLATAIDPVTQQTLGSYGHNTLGQRAVKTTTSGTVLFVHDEAGRLLGEYAATGNPIRQYVWLNDS